jgi:peptide/nickel transport system substrate-binding protein
MRSELRVAAAAASVMVIAISADGPALAQKPGGILRLSHFDSPASMSILEESTRAALQPMMGVFNNLVLYDQHIAQSSLETVQPDLATSWSWSEDFSFDLPIRRSNVHWTSLAVKGLLSCQLTP